MVQFSSVQWTNSNFRERERERERESMKEYPAVYRVAIFFAVNLAFSALSSDNFLSTNPSPLHSEHMPEPPQSSQTFVGI